MADIIDYSSHPQDILEVQWSGPYSFNVVGYNLCNQSCSMADIKCCLPTSLRRLLSPALFLFPHQERSRGWREYGGGLWLPGCWSGRAASTPALIPWIDKAEDSSCCPQRILAGARCRQAESISQRRQVLGIWRWILNKGKRNPREGREHKCKWGSCSFLYQGNIVLCFLHIAGGCRSTVKDTGKTLASFLT